MVFQWTMQFGTLCCVTLLCSTVSLGTSFSNFCGMWTWERADGHLTGSVRISGPAEILPKDEGNPG